ncbi:glycosyltransferase [Lacinutrix himadriensis]|uniref:glycosyltransferase n=1 Tax=Lacinutrix himadriensis TaxID=641549 RepID=UPI0006E39C3B|nr:glycosyltransferase [Lacinutrix himadriensis]
MHVLVANNKLERVGGTETFTFTLIQELLKQGHQVEYYTRRKGQVSNRIEQELGVGFKTRRSYDIVFANHNKIVRLLYFLTNAPIIQTIHGTTPRVEKPSIFADGYVAISDEIKDYLKSKYQLDATVIYNGINCQKYHAIHPIHEELKSVLSLSQSEKANVLLREVCKDLNIEFLEANKQEKTIVTEVLDIINQVDMVVGIGRSAYDAMACGRPVIIFDNRKYMGNKGDGYVHENVSEILYNNCSGRTYNKTYTKELLIEEFKKYDKKNGAFLRNFALEHLNIAKQVPKYFDLILEKRISIFKKLIHKRQLLLLKLKRK